MRPLRLLLDGFGSYRQPAEADFSDVDFFALTGPTGSGKSTLIDGLCFALYGTVPRWGKENAIAQALAPAANACRVCLIFETAGKRYGAVRALTRDRRGQVHTKEARLDLLDPQLPADAPIGEILAASIDQLAEGPDQVKERVQGILGLTYDHFTQSVLLPQGRFSEFLHAKPSERQNLLVELLAFGVYDKVGQLAREREKRAADSAHLTQQERATLSGATEEAETQAATRVTELAALAGAVQEKIAALKSAAEQAERAAQQAGEAQLAIRLLAGIGTPADVPGLAQRITDAERLVTERRQQRTTAEEAESRAQQAREALPDKTVLEMFRKAYDDQRELSAQLERHECELTELQAGQQRAEESLRDTEQELQRARDELAHTQRTHAAMALAQDLHIGEDCPVCLQPIATLPHHPAPAALAEAESAISAAEKEVSRSRAVAQKASNAVAAAARDAESTRKRIETISVALADASTEAEVTQSLTKIGEADELLRDVRQTARERRAADDVAEKARSALGQEEARAWAQLRKSRDSVVALGAPAIEDRDLAGAWETLTAWTLSQHAERTAAQPALDTAAAALRELLTREQAALLTLLADHGIEDITDSERASAAVATHLERAENDLKGVRRDREKAARLDEQIRGLREAEQVARELGRHLRATSFERWLCGEALDSLVAEASETLMELSAGQYQLDRNDRNDLIVIDYQDAGARRPVHTLSGGETFQASLALALALSRQVIGLSAGMRDLNSMFLDEGFGTLDEDTLETVATTLERLAADSDRMVGIITHVPALAERVPVRFVVSHNGATSALRKERV